MIDAKTLKAVIFDYGNTLVPFGAAAVEAINGALAATLARHYGRVDRQALDAIRARDRVQPYRRLYRENDLTALSVNLVRQLYGWDPAPEVVGDLLAARRAAYLASVTLPESARALLGDLRQRYVLGLLSNYPDGSVVRDSMAAIGIRHLFAAAVVSADVGYCKPHPRPFAAITEQLGIRPGTAILVGDNWLADVQGAKRFGMQAALVTQYASIETFEPQPGDVQPDLVLRCLDHLADHL